jgi:hypothetical protein
VCSFAQRAAAARAWASKLAEADAYDDLDSGGAAMGHGWGAEEEAARDAEDRRGDWFADMANDRRRVR